MSIALIASIQPDLPHRSGEPVPRRIRSSTAFYSKQLILPGEDPAEFDELRSSLRVEHQPANITEEILVDELAQSFWRMRRFREFETRAF